LRMSAAFRFTVRFYEVQSWARHHRKPSINALRRRGISLSGSRHIHECEEKAGGTQRREHRSPRLELSFQGLHACWRPGGRRVARSELADRVALRAVSSGGVLCRPCPCPCRCRRRCR
jgi:hypothetical protein